VWRIGSGAHLDTAWKNKWWEGRKEIRCVELGRRGKGREKGDNAWDPRVCVWRERVEGVVGIWRVKK
jgi:hypothetical protein